MKAIILAAGIGSRLRPITNAKPKCLVKVNHKPILSFIIDSLSAAGVKQLIVCVGYKAAEVINYCQANYPELEFIFVENHDYDTTNNMYSLFLAKDYLSDDLLLMNADLVIEPEIINRLLDEKTSAIAVDKGRYFDESMKVSVTDNVIQSISKSISPQDAFGTSIDIYKLLRQDVAKLMAEMDEIINQQQDQNQWTEKAMDNLFRKGSIQANPCDISGLNWYEIDNYTDLAKAELLFNKKIKQLLSKKLFLFDRDGTLTLGDSVLPGAKELLMLLNKHKKNVYVITNNSSKTPHQHAQKLADLGLNIKGLNTHVFVSTQALISYFFEHKISKVYWLANDDVSQLLLDNGLHYTESQPQAILLTYDDELHYDKLAKFCHLAQSGIPYYATHCDTVCPTPLGPIPDIGCFIKIIELTTGRTPNKVFGKPNSDFIEPILTQHNCNREDVVIIGDRLYTDIALANNTEMTSVLTCTGETSRDNYEFAEVQADIVVPNLQLLYDWLINTLGDVNGQAPLRLSQLSNNN